MRKYLLATTGILAAYAVHAQTAGSGSINGLQYQTLTSPDGCSAATPCQIVTYLHYLGGEGNVSSDVNKYFNTPAFWAANPHTIVLAPMVNGSSSTNNWGGVQDGMSSNMQAAIALVKQTEASVPTQTNNVVVTGGSMGGIGTEAAMVEAGPKGTVDPGVFARGLAYDGALYNGDASAAASALCGVPFTMVHGTSDTTVPYSYDQSLASKLSGCKGFSFVPIQDATHGTWNNPAWNGYAAGTLINQTMASSQSAGPQSISVADPTTPAQAATTPTTADITPGSGTVTSAAGEMWAISNDGNVMAGGQPVPGGGGTAQVTMAADGTLWGLDDGKGPSPCSGCWFTLNTDGQSWTPRRGQTPPTDMPTASDTAPLASSAPDRSCPANGPATGIFHVAGGQIIGPDGKPWIARGLNLYDDQLGEAAAMTASFPGFDFVRINIHSYQDPSAYQAFVTEMTSAGRVVEFEDHPDGGGGQDAGPPKGMAAELSWYGNMAKAYAGNPYVWFGTFNEPMATPGLSAWQRATYDAIRGAGNQNPILLEISGYPGNWTNSLDPSVYATMTNTIWDPHFYGWVSRYATDQAANDHALADQLAGIQQIKSADGTMPTFVGEFGNSTDGTTEDANGIQAVTSVVNAGSQKGVGSSAWAYNPGGNSDHVTQDGQITHPYGDMIRLFIGNTVVPMTNCQVKAWAQQAADAATAAALQQGN